MRSSPPPPPFQGGRGRRQQGSVPSSGPICSKTHSFRKKLTLCSSRANRHADPCRIDQSWPDCHASPYKNRFGILDNPSGVEMENPLANKGSSCHPLIPFPSPLPIHGPTEAMHRQVGSGGLLLRYGICESLRSDRMSGGRHISRCQPYVQTMATGNVLNNLCHVRFVG